VQTLISTLGQLHGPNPVLVGFVDTTLVDEPGLYLVDADSVDAGHEPGKWLQLSGTEPGVPTIPDPSRTAPFGHDRTVQPSLEVLCAIFDETFTMGHGEIVNNATRIRFTTDGIAIEREQPGLVKWLNDKTYGVGRW
jgi:hypothetical protein